MTAETSMIREVEILRQIVTERRRQRDKFGDQNPPDVNIPGHLMAPTPTAGLTAAATIGIARYYRIPTEQEAKARCDSRHARGEVTWADILVEEVCETVNAAARGNNEDLATELVQVAAVAVAWAEKVRAR